MKDLSRDPRYCVTDLAISVYTSQGLQVFSMQVVDATGIMHNSETLQQFMGPAGTRVSRKSVFSSITVSDKRRGFSQC